MEKIVFQSNGKHELQTVKESELYEQIGRLISVSITMRDFIKALFSLLLNLFPKA
jgi:hypothetical protein